MPDLDTQRRIRALEDKLERLRKADAVLTALSCRVFNSAAISITTSGVNQALTFNSETYDNGGFHDTGSNTGRLTFPNTGTYIVTGHAEFASNATGYRQLFIQRNGTDPLASILVPAVNGAVTVLSVATLFLFSANDYAELVVTQTSGGALNVDAVNFYTPYFAAARIA